MDFDFLKQFPKRMKMVGSYALLMKNSIQKTTWKQYGFETFEEQLNIIFALLLYIMEQSLKEEPCTIDDIGSFLDELNMTFFKKGMTYEQSKSLADYIINVILGDEGRAMYVEGYNFDKNSYESIHISYIANRVIYIEEDIKRTSYYLTDDGYNLVLSTLEIESNMKLTIHEMIFQLHLEKATYDKAVEEIKNIFNMLRIQVQKIKEAMRKMKQNVLHYSVQDYRELLEENLNTIEDTKNRFMMYRAKVVERVNKLEEENINLTKFEKKDIENLYNLKIIEGYLNRSLEEHQKILTSHFDMKSLYSKELESLSQMALIRRFDITSDLYEPLLNDIRGLENIELFLRPLFNQTPEKTYNLNLAFLRQVSLRKQKELEEDEVIQFDETKWQEELTRKKKEKLNKYYICLEQILTLMFNQKSITLKEMKEIAEEEFNELIERTKTAETIELTEINELIETTLPKSIKEALIPTVEIFKEVVIELIKTKEIQIEELRKERQESLDDGLLDFQLNQAILDIIKEHTKWDNITKICIKRLDKEEEVVFENLLSDTGIRKRIRCSNILFEME